MWYRGIKEYFPKLPLSARLKALLVNSRPVTLSLPLLGGFFVIQASLPEITFPTPNPLRTWLALLALVLVNAGGNNINSVFDIQIDAVNKPYRPLVKGILTRRLVGVFGATLLLLSILLSFLVNPTFLLWNSILVMTTILYSTPPIRLKRLLWINNLTQATARGILGVFTAWSVYSTVTKGALAMSLVLFSFILWSQTSKDIPDLLGDKMYEINTLPVVYGVDGAKKIMTCMVPAPFIATATFVWIGWLPVSSLLTLLLLPLALYIPHGTTQTDRAENTYGWLCFYASMVGFLLLFMVTI